MKTREVPRLIGVVFYTRDDGKVRGKPKGREEIGINLEFYHVRTF